LLKIFREGDIRKFFVETIVEIIEKDTLESINIQFSLNNEFREEAVPADTIVDKEFFNNTKHNFDKLINGYKEYVNNAVLRSLWKKKTTGITNLLKREL